MTFPNIDPIIFSVGPISIYWYGALHLLAFIISYWLLLRRGPKQRAPWKSTEIIDLVFYAAVGVIIGGRVGYILFYDLESFLLQPWTLVEFWQPGRSFHGGMLGVILSFMIFGKFHQRKLLDITDYIAPVIPIGLGLGRLGNFINGELWGRVTDLPWGMIFPHIGFEPRHPSQLYALFLEGLLLFIILWVFSNKLRSRGVNSGLFLFLYGIFRVALEFLREPDHHLGFVAFNWLTMGQLLSIPMILLGLYLMFFYKRDTEHAAGV